MSVALAVSGMLHASLLYTLPVAKHGHWGQGSSVRSSGATLTASIVTNAIVEKTQASVDADNVESKTANTKPKPDTKIGLGPLVQDAHDYQFAAAPPQTSTILPDTVVSGEKPRAGEGAPITPRFYEARELNNRAIPINPPQIEYPPGVNPNAAVGYLKLAIYIDATGKVIDAEVVTQRVEQPIAEAAEKAFRATRFLPARLEGIAVPSRMLVEITYGLETSPASSQSSDMGLRAKDR